MLEREIERQTGVSVREGDGETERQTGVSVRQGDRETDGWIS